MEMVNSFKKFLIATVPYIVVKNAVEANACETLDSMREADLYVSCSLGANTFASHYQYPAEVLRRSGMIDEALIRKAAQDKDYIPFENRKRVVVQMRKWVIDKYVEKNGYYRMLAGLPKLDQEPIYVPLEELHRHGYHPANDIVPPLHELPVDILISMEGTKYLYELADQYPDHEYIPYLGVRKVNIVNARRAGHFELLYFPKQDVAYRFYRDFLSCYDESREYFMTVVFNYDYVDQIEYYNEWIGFMILHMTIQKMINTMFKVLVDRDFYDLDTIRLFLDSYQIPYVDIFTMSQQKLLVKNLNILLRKKGNTQVLYDLLSLLGYENFEILKYMLVKQHKLVQENDESPLKPIFVYRTMVADDGTPYIELDSSQMYDYYFVGIPMNEIDPVIPSEKTDGTVYDYHEFTNNDPTWIKDSALIRTLDELQKNYIETKYANININFKMQEITFELVYLGRLIVDRRVMTDKILMQFALFTEKPVSLYDIQILLICLMCKRNQMEPDILKNPSQILYIDGFNFEEDIEKIRADVMARPDLFDPEIVEYIKVVQFNRPKDVNDMYVVVKRLNQFLTTAMQTTQDIDAYHAYRHLYNTLLISEYQEEIYKLKDGTMPNQFTEVLRDENEELYEFYEKIESDKDCIDYINYIAIKLSTVMEDTEFMSYLNPVDVNVVEAILTILRAFKSLTVDIRSIDVLYIFDSRLHNMMRMIDRAWMKVYLYPQEHDQPYQDFPILFKGRIHKDERNAFYLDRSYMSAIMSDQDASLYVDVPMLYSNIYPIETTMATPFSDSFVVEETIHGNEQGQRYGDRVKFKWSDEDDWKTVP